MTCMKSVVMVSAVVHTLGYCLSACALFIAHVRTLDSCGTGTQKKDLRYRVARHQYHMMNATIILRQSLPMA